MRTLEELIASVSRRSDYNFSEDTEYQELFEAKKTKEEQDLPQGIWENMDATLSWSDLEQRSWEMLIKKGNDAKLLVLWAEAYLAQYGIEGLSFVLQSVLIALQNDQAFFSDTQEQRFSMVRYMDKSLGKILLTLNLNSEKTPVLNLLQFENFNLGNYADFHALVYHISDIQAGKLEELYADISKNLTQLREYLNELQCDNLTKVAGLIEQLHNFLQYRKDSMIVHTDDVVVSDAMADPHKDLFYYRNVAYKSIEDAVELLYRVDSQNLALPLLQKLLKWKDLTLLEIFEEFGSSAEIDVLLKLLKNNEM